MRLRKLLLRVRDTLHRRVSSNSRFHFIHFPKNDGNSIRAALLRSGDVSASKPYHYRYVDIADKIGRHLQFFCIIRNPWSRTTSRFKFAKQNAEKWAADDPRRLYIENAAFSDFVKDQKFFPIPEHPGQPKMGPMNSWFNQLEWIKGENGIVVCDCLRLKNLTYDLSKYFSQALPEHRRNTTKDEYDYRRIYTSTLVELVARKFKDDIDYFGFTFESAATINIAVLE